MPPGELSWDEKFEKAYPQARLFIELWRVAYSKDGKTALVRFWFGPTAHGATGTYLLRKEDRMWKILHRRVSYYA